MDKDTPFRIRPGKIRSCGEQRVRPFVNQALAAAQKAGATVRHGRISTANGNFGRGRQASLAANRLLTHRTRRSTVKARVVRHRGRPSALKAHLKYLQREGVTQDGEKTVMFGAEQDRVDSADFADRCAEDRHHFRFIVSPEDAIEMTDLKRFTRDLMDQAQLDLGTRLDWAAVCHWNTEHPHVHVIVRGVTDAGDDLVISRDYIKEGLRARAQVLVTDELGPRTDLEIRQALHRQVDAERLTQLDRQLRSDARRFGFIDLAPASQPPDEFHVLKVARMRKLEALGLADQFAPGQWILSDAAEQTLRALGERGDIIKRIHQGLAEHGDVRPSHALSLGERTPAGPIIGKLLARGLDDELKGTAYVIVDGLDGHTHHVRVPDLESTGDAAKGSIVSVQFRERDGAEIARVRVESDFDVPAQITARGATWLDRQLVRGNSSAIAVSGFGAEVDAMAVVLAALTLLGLGIFGPGVANGLVSGGPQLGAGAAVGAGLAAGGTVAAGMMTMGMAARGASALTAGALGAARSATTAAGAASTAYNLGAMGKSGPSAVAGGLANVAKAGTAAMSKSASATADAFRDSFRDGSRAAFAATGGQSTKGTVSGGTGAGSKPAGGTTAPGWANDLRRNQTFHNTVGTTIHAVQSGDAAGGGHSLDLKESS